MTEQPFLLGVNYWPRRKAMYWWRDFDAAEVDEEFAVIASLGMRVVRIFLLWDDFQPTPDAVSPQALANLVVVADTAVRHGLQLDVTFFTGHMSGPNWAPRWLLDPQGVPASPTCRQIVSDGRIVEGGYRNMYHDPVALDAARLQLREVVTRLKDHAGIWCWNLGNEPDLFAYPNTHADGKAWVQEMIALIRSIDPAHPVTCGLHGDSLVRDNGLRIHDVFADADFGVMHAYPMYAEGWSHGPLDSDFVPFTCALTAALSGKPVLMEEFGGCTAAPGSPSEVWEWTAYGSPRTQFMASEEDFAQYIREVLPNLVSVGALGAFFWCYADYVPELWELPPCKESKHERFFGLVRPDGSLKPHAQVIREFAATRPLVRPATRTVSLDVTPEAYYEAPAEHAVRLYRTQYNPR
jgi:endo-1,4-beta-mannosidase